MRGRQNIRPLRGARFALAHPRTALCAWLVAVAVLAAVGLGIDGRLAASGLEVSGSESAQARALVGAQFDDGATVPVLLRGPRTAVKTQGRILAGKLARQPGVQVVSPWTASAGKSPLRPSGDRALLLLSITGERELTARRTEAAERLVDRITSAPVSATVTGLPALSREGTQASLSAVHRAELIALPLLLLALLLVFRSPLAAALPALFGGATILSGTGALALLAGYVRLDAFAVALASMMGLALAVDYSLLMISRLREERAAEPDGDVRDAVARAVPPTTRTVAAAGAAIVGAMAVAAALSPGTAVLSSAIGVGVVAALSVIGVVLAVPAALLLLGNRLDRFAAPHRAAGRGISARLASTALRRPLLGVLALLALLAAAIPALELRTAVPGASSLPSDSPARADHETITGAMGAGWAEPFEIVAVTRRGTVTTADRLAELERTQRSLAADPAVRAVLGPGSMARSAARLRRVSSRAVRSASDVPGTERLQTVQGDVTSAASGVGALRGALEQATTAAGRIDAGSRDVKGGVTALREGLQGAGSGAQRLVGRLSAAGAGARDLAADATRARGGITAVRGDADKLDRQLKDVSRGARDLQGRLHRRGDTLDRARNAVRSQRTRADEALSAAERALPRFGSANARRSIADARKLLSIDAGAVLDEPLRALNQDAGFAGALAAATPRRTAESLAKGTRRLSESTDRLAGRLGDLGGTVRELSGGTNALLGAIGRLDGGAQRLGSAFGAVTAGVDGLSTGVREGRLRTGQLEGGLRDAGAAVRDLGAAGRAAAGGSPDAKAATPGFFDSGYFLLAALDGGATAGAPFGVNVDRGGQGARIVVVPRHGLQDPRTRALYERLQDTAGELGSQLDARAAVGGPAAMLVDYDVAADRRLPLIVIVLALVTAGMLGVLLRSIVVPLIGVALNLLAVGATLGLLALLFQGAEPPLGGPGEIDAVALTAIFGLVFALSIDYQVFIVARVREEFERTGDELAAVREGVARTAGVVTGAALSMLGVFAAFAMTDIASLRQFGVGLAIAVAIDATLVRLVLLPVALRLAGRWAWWLPGRSPAAPDRSGEAATAAPLGPAGKAGAYVTACSAQPAPATSSTTPIARRS